MNKEITTLSKQPLGLYLLALGTFCERFSYYGAQTILVLYLSKIFLLPESASYAMYGVYTTFAFALPVIGGIFADRFLGNKIAIIVGSIFLILGNIFLSFQQAPVFLIGLGILVCGTGLYKSSITAFVGKLYTHENQHALRDNGYITFYIAMNIGASLGGVIYGISTNFSGFLSWRMGFMVSSLLIVVSLVSFLVFYQRLGLQQIAQKIQVVKSTRLIAYMLGLLGVLAVIFVFFHPELLKYLLIIFCLLLPWLIYNIAKYPRQDWWKILTVLSYLPFVIAFFIASFQIASSVTVFISHHIYHTLWSWNIPPTFFSALYPISVIVIAPMLGILFHQLSIKYYYQFSAPGKISAGLLMAGIAFICFMLADSNTYMGTSIYPLGWIIGGIFLLGLGEALIFPALLSDVSKLVPSNLQNTLMGTSFLAVAFSGYLSSVADKLLNEGKVVGGKLSMETYHHFFFMMTIFSIIAATLLFLIKPLFLRFTKNSTTV